MMAKAGTKPTVLHYRERYPVLSETFIRETVFHHRRYEPVVLTNDRQSRDLAGVRVIERPAGRVMRLESPLSTVGLARRSWILRAAAASVAADVVHAHFGKEGFIAASRVAAIDAPLVVSFYGYDATYLAEFDLWRRRFRRVFRCAAAILAEGPGMAARLMALGAPEERVVLHRIPVRIGLFPFSPPRPPVDGPLVFLQACRFVEKKGVDVTIAAFARIADELPTSVLWLMGSGPDEPALRSLAERSGVSHRISFLPPASHEEYAATLRRAHIFVHPSRTSATGDGEGGAPTALLEAQLLGLPIVATTHDDIPSIVDPEATLLASPGDVDGIARHMLNIARSPHEWTLRAEAGRRLVMERHDPDRLVADLENLYDRVRR